MASKKTSAEERVFRTMDRKAAVSDAEKARKVVLKKTENLRALRLAKEAEDKAAAALKPKKKAKAKKRTKLPTFERAD
jgi:hypothetical protein